MESLIVITFVTNHDRFNSYTAMQWDEKSKDWYGVEYCETPEELKEELLSLYCMAEAEKMTKAKRELTEEEIEIAKAECQKLIDRCESM